MLYPLSYTARSHDRNRTCDRRIIEVTLVFTTGEIRLSISNSNFVEKCFRQFRLARNIRTTQRAEVQKAFYQGVWFAKL